MQLCPQKEGEQDAHSDQLAKVICSSAVANVPTLITAQQKENTLTLTAFLQKIMLLYLIVKTQSIILSESSQRAHISYSINGLTLITVTMVAVSLIRNRRLLIIMICICFMLMVSFG